jgi:soluble lytic murein transglycosylase-like protein
LFDVECDLGRAGALARGRRFCRRSIVVTRDSLFARGHVRPRRTGAAAPAADERASLDALIAQHAGANGVPASLVRRTIMRESRYSVRAVSGGNYGLMQIRLRTARAMGYRGSAAGLLDPATNMTYAVRYLAGAYRAAGGNESRAMALYQTGYHASRRRRRSI